MAEVNQILGKSTTTTTVIWTRSSRDCNTGRGGCRVPFGCGPTMEMGPSETIPARSRGMPAPTRERRPWHQVSTSPWARIAQGNSWRQLRLNQLWQRRAARAERRVPVGRPHRGRLPPRRRRPGRRGPLLTARPRSIGSRTGDPRPVGLRNGLAPPVTRQTTCRWFPNVR